MTELVKISEIVYRKDLYPRFEPCQKTIQKYANSIEHLPPIKVNQNKILIDGFHRWKAHALSNLKEIHADVIETESEAELKKRAYQLNANHGLQLSAEEKRKYAQEMIGNTSIKELSIILSVSEKTINRWTKTQIKAIKEEQDRKILELYLHAWNTQEAVSEAVGVPRSTIANYFVHFGQMSEMDKTSENDESQSGVKREISKRLKDFDSKFSRYLYNIWNQNKQDVAIDSHFGAFPEIYLENLLYYHTNILDIVFDPFAGSGSTVDVCKRMVRRYFCSDLNVKPGRENDILQHDITKGMPESLPKPKLAFLDPPYWRQAEKKYSDEKTDLGNMTDINDFNNAMESLLKALYDKKAEQIAIVIQPTQYKNNWNFTDHIFDFNSMLSSKYRIKMRYILPYSTQQYNAQMVEKAKETNECLVINRDLVVWERNK